MAIYIRKSGCIGLYIPSGLKISLGHWVCTNQHTPPLGSVRIQPTICLVQKGIAKYQLPPLKRPGALTSTHL